MNPRITTLLLVITVAGGLNLGAQPPAGDRPPPPPPGPPPTVERFFEIIRNRNPDEYERLRQLRETDPTAFRQEILDRIERERARRGFAPPAVEGPGPRAFRNGDRETRRPRGGDAGDAMKVHSPEIEAHERKAQELAEQARSAKTDEERAALLKALRAELASAFDLREQMRRERIQQMRERLEKVESFLALRQANRDAILDRRVRELIGEDPTSW